MSGGGWDEVVRSRVKAQDRHGNQTSRLTLHSGDLLVHRAAGQGVFQGVKVDVVGRGHLSEREKKLRQQDGVVVSQLRWQVQLRREGSCMCTQLD